MAFHDFSFSFVKFRLDDISLIKPATNQVGSVEINYLKYFYTGYIEKNSKGYVGAGGLQELQNVYFGTV